MKTVKGKMKSFVGNTLLMVITVTLLSAQTATQTAASPASQAAAQPVARRPNILWFVVDDMSANFSSYGEKLIETPNVDRLAREGTRFSRAFTTGPVCSPSRSALITGMYQTSINAHHHRSGRGAEKIRLPAGVEPVPVLFKRAGYYTANGGPQVKDSRQLAKTDYNFEWDQAMYDGNDWSGRRPGQPFFMQVQLHGGKLRHNKNWSQRALNELGSLTKPESVTLPPYYPRDTVLLEDWAQYLDAVRYTDREVGDVLRRLEKEGILDQTVIIFMTDHGISHAREKQFLYDGGTHVPFIVRGPGVESGAVRDDLIEHIDAVAISLALAEIEIPKGMQARNVFAKDYRKRDAVFSARDRCDETVDRIRSVRTEGFKYIRNFYPQRPHLQPNAYKDGKEIVQRLREMHAGNKLGALAEKILFSPTRAPEEMYDVRTDPHETRNLAADPKHGKALREMRERLNRWIKESVDRGQQPEPAAMFDSDMAVYLQEIGGRREDRLRMIRDNIALMKRWVAEGK
ncbi:MAG: sulfatase [Acidobacteriota bacterium]|nr:sulfatase [Acidobacteriota bacterium]